MLQLFFVCVLKHDYTASENKKYYIGTNQGAL